MVTLKITIENEAYALMFAEILANFKFVNTVEIPELSKKLINSHEEENCFVLPAVKRQDIQNFYGIWANKNIEDVKQFRQNK